MSVVRFAAYIDVDERAVTRWETSTNPRPAHRQILDTALCLATTQQQHQFAVQVATAELAGLAPVEGDEPGWVIHLHVQVTDPADAAALARALCVKAQAPAIVAGLTTVSRYGALSEQRQVFCDRRLSRVGNRRYPRPAGHAGSC